MLLLAALICFGLTACGGTGAESSKQKENDSVNNPTEENKQDTETKAEDTLNADLYEIVPEEPYTSEDLDYNDDNSRSTKEMNDPSNRPAVSGSSGIGSSVDALETLAGNGTWLEGKRFSGSESGEDVRKSLGIE